MKSTKLGQSRVSNKFKIKTKEEKQLTKLFFFVMIGIGDICS